MKTIFSNTKRNELYLYAILSIIIIAGLILRIIGIVKGLSFWNDEDNVALYARGILEHGLPINGVGKSLGLYQIGLFYITALSFKLFSVSEFTARLPSILVGTVLCVVVFYIVNKILGKREAILATFLTSFSQIQLAWSTQLRPYIWLELFTLVVLYYCYLYLHQKKMLSVHLLAAFVWSGLAAFFHGTGLLNILIIAFVILYKSIKLKKYQFVLLIVPLCIFIFTILFFSFSESFIYLLRLNLSITHYEHFIIKNYIWLFLGAFFGIYYLWKEKQKTLVILLSFSITFIFAVANFKISDSYVRYSLPAFPLLYILFSKGITGLFDVSRQKYNEWYKQIGAVIALFLIFFLFPIYEQKLIFVPKFFYSINADVRENPIVDYKSAFQKIKKLIQNHDNVIVMDAWNDRVPYYLPGQKFILLMKDAKTIDPQYGEKIIGTISEFEKEKKEYNSGIVILENWESLTPPELQNHIKQTLKHEFDVNNLPYNINDKWSISIYSWGI